MHERPQGELFHALRRLGYRIDSENDNLPAVFHGTGPNEAACTVSLNKSSQFASALLLSAGAGKWIIDFAGARLEEAPYVQMTCELIKAFPNGGGEFAVEPDASSGSYFWGVNCFHEGVEVANWPLTGWQVDAQFPRFLSQPREVSRQNGSRRQHHDGDSARALGGSAHEFHGLGPPARAGMRARSIAPHRA